MTCGNIWRDKCIWKITDKVILPSLMEQMKEANCTKMSGGGNPSDKPCIVTKKCVNCGTEKVERI